ncbi:MAG: hypothetical protein J0H65_04930 [Rhizobiales bacterium]|nr:hypothetical protein [Hyphomicrobiales bacterium]
MAAQAGQKAVAPARPMGPIGVGEKSQPSQACGHGEEERGDDGIGIEPEGRGPIEGAEAGDDGDDLQRETGSRLARPAEDRFQDRSERLADTPRDGGCAEPEAAGRDRQADGEGARAARGPIAKDLRASGCGACKAFDARHRACAGVAGADHADIEPPLAGVLDVCRGGVLGVLQALAALLTTYKDGRAHVIAPFEAM